MVGRMKTFAVVLALGAFGTLAGPVHAQSVEAEVLFRDGKKLLKEGKIAEACEKLEASEKLESTPGTLLNLADCREKNHQLASAWAAFHKAAVAAKRAHDKRETEARRREKLLEARLSYLTITVSDASKLDGLAIERNGTAVDPALWNAAVPVDAGEYEITGHAPGHEAWSKKVTIDSEGKKVTIDVPQLAAPTTHVTQPDHPIEKPHPIEKTHPVEQPHPVVHTDDTNEGDPTGSTSVEKHATPSSFTGKRKAALAFGALGAAGIGVGIALGLHAKDLEKQSDALCPTSTCNDDKALKLNSDARAQGLYANIGYIGGGALVATAVVLWFTGAPKIASEEVAVTPVVTGDQLGFSLAGRF
jgi:hypothetical protein